MLRRILLSTAVMCSFAVPVFAQTADEGGISDEKWAEVRLFLEENPGLMDQLDALMSQPSPEEQASVDAANIQANSAALFSEEAPFVGNPDGDIVLVKFTDYSCGHCKAMNQRMAEIMEGNDRIQIKMKEFPILGERSLLAARFALAVHDIAGDEAYQSVHDQLFNAGELSVGVLKSIAEEAGVDGDTVIEAMDAPEITQTLEENIALAQAMGISGTPGFIVNKVIVRGSIPTNVMERVINEYYPEQ